MKSTPSDFLGEIWTEAKPSEDPVLYGHAALEPRGAFQARSLQTFKLSYRAGRFGLDDTGSIKIVFRFTADGGPLQMDDPAGLNYVTAHSSNGVALRLSFSANGHQRPWYQALTVEVRKGYLCEGDEIEVIFGDRSGGSPGLRLQSFCESAFAFKVLADVCATGHYVPISESPTVSIVPGPPVNWKAVLPTLRRPGESFRLGIKAEDAWGNPSDQVDERLTLEPDLPVTGLPAQVRFTKGQRALVLEDLSINGEGCLRIKIRNAACDLLVESNPMMVREGTHSSFWGDMHGQSGESVGINTAREYFVFARDLAFLDATSHQANDFQVNNAFWSHINELTAEFHVDHRFLTLPGYEWSGNTAVGGDRNVYYRRENRPIRRSSHALIPDRADIDSDATTARELFDALQDEDCVIYAHIGGRPADVTYAHDPRLETAIEIHSAWGTFEWLLEDCFKLGHRVGIVANSDGHKGRPGASYPGASEFGAYGGLTCFLTEQLTRDSLFDCLRHRKHYATSGDRIHIDLEIEGAAPFAFYGKDPVAYDCPAQETHTLTMGDIAGTELEEVSLRFMVAARAPIERIDVMNGMKCVETVRGYQSADLGQRIRVLWRGALTKGRGARARWKGHALFRNCRIVRTNEVNGWNPERPIRLESDQKVSWESVTAGNFGAFDVWLEEGSDARLEIDSNHVTARLDLTSVGLEDQVFRGGGLDLELKVFRLPEVNESRSLSGCVAIPLEFTGDNPVWLRVTTEDGFQAWTSPVYLFR